MRRAKVLHMTWVTRMVQTGQKMCEKPTRRGHARCRGCTTRTCNTHRSGESVWAILSRSQHSAAVAGMLGISEPEIALTGPAVDNGP